MQINQMLGDYKLLELIGKGGQGKVYKALDAKLNRIVAIKVFFANDKHRRQKLASFKYEARLASALDHPNICTVYALFEDESHTFMVMEYVEGRNLFELAFGRPLEIKSALNIMIQLTDALIAAHGQGIIHRDIKPRNVMVTKNGRVIVLDFGLAKLLENPDGSFDFDADEIAPADDADKSFVEDIAESLFITREGEPYGSPASSPPEMALGKPTDHRGDVFSTGVLLYLLLTGTYPFLAKTKAKVRDKVINEEPVPVSVARTAESPVPLSLIAIVRRALRKKPEERFQTMTEMREALLAVFSEAEKNWDEKKSTRFPAFPAEGVTYYASPHPKRFERKPLVIISAGFLILVLILVCCFLYF